MTPEQRAIIGILVNHLGGGFNKEREAAAEAQYGRAALDAAKAMVKEALWVPVDWKRHTMDDGLLIMSQHMNARYPWLTEDARWALTFAFTYAWK